MTPPGARIETPRLLLRAWQPADAPLLKDAIDANLDHLRAWMPWAHEEPSTIDVLEERLARFAGQFAAGEDWIYAIFSRDERTVLGGTGLHPRLEGNALEIGYWLRAAATGQGYATEAAAALTLEAFDAVGVEHMEIRCDPRNTSSARVPERLGYVHVRTIRGETTTPDGAARDTMVWLMDAGAYGRERERLLALASPDYGNRLGRHS